MGGGRFDEWYKRRIRRIYPSIIAVAIIGSFVFGKNDTFFDVIIAKRYWFVQCIFVLYPLLFLAKKYFTKHILLLGVLTALIMAVFPFVYKGGSIFWGSGYYRWAVFLLFMLLGAIIGKERDRIKQMSLWLSIMLTILCVVAWYGIAFFFEKSLLHIFSIIPMMGLAFSVYCVGKSSTMEKLMHSKMIGQTIISIGALCLESYLIQKMIITDSWNGLFPLNIPIIMLLVLIASYCAKILANLIGQVFDSRPLIWKDVLRIY